MTTRSLQVLKALAGNDRVKTEAGRDGMLPLVVTAMDRHVTRAPLVEAGCAAITSLTLRQVWGELCLTIIRLIIPMIIIRFVPFPV